MLFTRKVNELVQIKLGSELKLRVSVNSSLLVKSVGVDIDYPSCLEPVLTGGVITPTTGTLFQGKVAQLLAGQQSSGKVVISSVLSPTTQPSEPAVGSICTITFKAVSVGIGTVSLTNTMARDILNPADPINTMVAHPTEVLNNLIFDVFEPVIEKVVFSIEVVL